MHMLSSVRTDELPASPHLSPLSLHRPWPHPHAGPSQPSQWHPAGQAPAWGALAARPWTGQPPGMPHRPMHCSALPGGALARPCQGCRVQMPAGVWHALDRWCVLGYPTQLTTLAVWPLVACPGLYLHSQSCSMTTSCLRREALDHLIFFSF